jgi:glutamine synthetase
LEALRADTVLTAGIGPAFINYFIRIKQAELLRWEQAGDKDEFQRREYFGRI